MMFRTNCRAALVAGLLLSLGLGARMANACDGAACPTASAARPLDLMKFMHGKGTVHRAANERTVSARQTPRTVARTHHAHGTAVAHTEPAPLPAPAATAFASEPEPNAAEPNVQVKVPVVASDELNDIDRAMAPVQAETNGAAPSADPSVRMVEAEQFNDIDRKTADVPALSADRTANDPAVSATGTSWLENLWSSWSSWVWTSFSTAVMAVRQLFG